MRIVSWLRQQHRNYVFSSSMKQLVKAPDSLETGSQLLRDLVYGWSNEAWSAADEYLGGCLEYARNTKGPILECGSGLTTLLLGVIAQRMGKEVWSMEHHPAWAQKVQGMLDKWGIRSVRLCRDDLRDYGGYSWYTVPAKGVPNDFGLVICDGPPGATPGGRYGMLPVMRERLRDGCVVLIDDVERQAERDLAARWAKEYDAKYEFKGDRKPYAVMRVPRAAAPGASAAPLAKVTAPQ